MKVRAFTALTLLICSLLHTHSQKMLDFDALSIDDGFSSSKAISMLQDRKGFIWIGTWNGLNKYDGYGCETYKPLHHTASTLSNKEITALFEDSEGNIWIGTSNGLNRLNPETEQLTSFPFPGRILAIYEDKSHTFWIGTSSDGLFRFNPSTDSREQYLHGNTVSHIHEDTKGEFWIATYNGLINLNRQTGTFSPYLPNPSNPGSSISHAVTTQIAETADGSLWIGTWGGGLNKMVRNADKSRVRFVHYLPAKREGAIASANAYKVLADEYGNVWVGHWNEGLSLLPPEEQNKEAAQAGFSNYANEITNPFSLSGNNITALLVDRSGMLWVGSSKINRAYILPTGLTRFNTQKMVDNHITQSVVRAIGGDLQHKLWIGTTEALELYKKSGNGYQFAKQISNLEYNYNGENFASASVLEVLDDRNGLWVGTDNAGLLLFSTQDALKNAKPSFKFWNDKTPERLPGNKIDIIVPSRTMPNTYWIGTMYSGMAKCVYANGKLHVTTIQAGESDMQLSDNSVRALVEDKQGIVWIATNRGLNRLDPTTGKISKFQYRQNDTTTINDNIINTLLLDNDNTLWIGTSAGLNKKVEKTDDKENPEIWFKNYPSNKHISNELITNLLLDENGKVWIGLYSGMVRFDTKSETVEAEYFTKDYQRLGYERNTAYIDGEGSMFLGGTNGFLSFHPNKLVSKAPSPKVVVTDLMIYNERVTFQTLSGNAQVLSKPMPFTSDITLAYRDNVFTLEFSAMDYKAPKRNEYAYYLEGFDRQWNEVGNRNTATYTGIPPGNYVFKVKACNSDKVWSDEVTELKITILPPWWKTWYAYLLYAITMLGLLYLFKQYAVQQLKQRNALSMQRLNYEKEHELNEMKSQFFTNITHEFRTPLSLILGPTNELLARKDMPPVVTKQALLIQKSAQRLLRLVNQLMEFRRVEKENLQLFLQLADVVQLVEDAYNSFMPMAEKRGIRFEFVKKQQKIMAQIDVDKFDKIMFNLLSNAFKFTDDGGSISIRVDLVDNDPERFFVEVEDTGIGIPADKKELVFSRFYQINQKKSQSTGGIGLYLSKAFVQQHNGNIELDSEHGHGSVFRVVLPLANVQQAGSNTAVEADAPQREKDEVASFDEANEDEEQTSSNLPVLLVVEDDHDMNDFIATGLESEFTVVSCFNGKEGLEQAKKLLPDLILSDVMMPELNGFELCKQLRKDINTSHIPLMFLTAKNMKDDELKGLRLGAVDYITKPFDLTTLRLKLTNVLQTTKSLQEKLRTNMLLEPEEIELTSLDEEFLKDVVEAVNKHLDNPEFDVELLSKEVRLSPNQVYRKIKSLTGQTAKEFIRSQRLKTAASMLLQKKRSISEIIYMVGFSSPSYFARCFKEHFGCTPSEYIERN